MKEVIVGALEDGIEPCESDIVIQEERNRVKAYTEGKCIIDAANWDEMKWRVEAWMRVGSFYPNVWFMSDHGNAHLITTW